MLFVDREVQAEFLEDFDRAEGFHGVELSCDFASASSENTEFNGSQNVLEVRALADELLEEDATALNKVSIVVVGHLHVLHIHGVGNLLGDSRDVAAGPALRKHSLQGLKLVKSSLASPLALLIAARHRVLHDLADLDRVTHGEMDGLLLCLVLVVLEGTLSLLALRVERHDLLDQVSLGIIGAHHQILGTSSALVLGIVLSTIDVVAGGCRGLWHGDWGLAHKVGALSAEAKRHTLLGVGILCGRCLLDRHLLRSVLLLLTAEQVLLLLLRLLGLLRVGVGRLLGSLLLSVWVSRLFLLLLILLLLGLDYRTRKGSPILSYIV